MVLLDLVASYLHGRRQDMQLYHLIMHISCACNVSLYIPSCNDLQRCNWLQCPHR